MILYRNSLDFFNFFGIFNDDIYISFLIFFNWMSFILKPKWFSDIIIVILKPSP